MQYVSRVSCDKEYGQYCDKMIIKYKEKDGLKRDYRGRIDDFNIPSV